MIVIKHIIIIIVIIIMHNIRIVFFKPVFELLGFGVRWTPGSAQPHTKFK